MKDAGGKLDGVVGEVVLDFSSVGRIDVSAVRRMEELAGRAEGKGVNVVLRGVSISVYGPLARLEIGYAERCA